MQLKTILSIGLAVLTGVTHSSPLPALQEVIDLDELRVGAPDGYDALLLRHQLQASDSHIRLFRRDNIPSDVLANIIDPNEPLRLASHKLNARGQTASTPANAARVSVIPQAGFPAVIVGAAPGPAIVPIPPAARPTNANTLRLQKAVQDAQNALLEAEHGISKDASAAGGYLSSLEHTVADTLASGAHGVGHAAQSGVDAVRPLVNAAGQSIGNAVGAVESGLGRIASNFNDAVSGLPAEARAAEKAAEKAAANAASRGATAAGNVASRGATAAQNAAAQVGNAVSRGATAAQNAAARDASAAQSALVKGENAAVNAASSIGTTIGNTAADIYNGVANGFSTVGSVLGSGVSALGSGVHAILNGAANGAQAVGNGVGATYDGTKQLVTSIGEAIAPYLDVAGNACASTGNCLTHSANGIIDLCAGTGKCLVNGASLGYSALADGAGFVGSRIAQAGAAVRDGVANAAGTAAAPNPYYTDALNEFGLAREDIGRAVVGQAPPPTANGLWSRLGLGN